MEYSKEAEKAPGKGLLRVSSILMVILSSLVLVLALIGIIAAGTIGGIIIAAASTFVVIFAFLPTIAVFITGVLGIAYAGKPEKATVCLVFGIVVVILTLISIFTSGFTWGHLVGLILPVLYVIGAARNKQAA
jgi:hypothetical protein